MTCAKGFTLIEMMVAIAVAAILLAIAMPALDKISANNALKSTARDLVSTINTGRSQSISTRTDVLVEPAAGGWADGWSILYDNAAAEENQDYLPKKGVSVSRVDSTDSLTFLSRGGLQGGAARFSVCHKDLGRGQTISVSFLGKVTTEVKEDC